MKLLLNPDAEQPEGENWVYSNKYYIEKFGDGPFTVKDNDTKTFTVYLPDYSRLMYKSRFLPEKIKNIPYEDMM